MGLDAEYGRELEEELALEKLEHSEPSGALPTSAKPGKLLREVVLNPGLYLLFGGIVIGLVSRLQGAKVVHDGDTVPVNVSADGDSLVLG